MTSSGPSRYQPGGQGPYPVPRPPLRRADLAASITLLVLSGLLVLASGFIGLFSLAFLDSCTAPTCSVDGASTAVLGAVAAEVVAGLLGGLWAVLRMQRRRSSWPISLAVLLICAAAVTAGVFGYVAAVG